MTQTTAMRVIKKYPNRRLYDLRTSSYITLVEIKQMVLLHEQFQVVDAKSGEDLTRNILLQIILEEEAGGAPMFTSDLLAQMIRFYGHAMQGMMGQYLESNIKSFSDLQKKLHDQAHALYGDNSGAGKDLWAQFLNFQGPAMQSMMTAYADQSRKIFQQMQGSMQKQASKLFTSFPFPVGESENDQEAGPADSPKAKKTSSGSKKSKK